MPLINAQRVKQAWRGIGNVGNLPPQRQSRFEQHPLRSQMVGAYHGGDSTQLSLIESIIKHALTKLRRQPLSPGGGSKTVAQIMSQLMLQWTHADAAETDNLQRLLALINRHFTDAVQPPAVQPLRQPRFGKSGVRIRPGGIKCVGGRIAVDAKQVACIVGANRTDAQTFREDILRVDGCAPYQRNPVLSVRLH